MAKFDTVLKGGMVVDGTRSQRYRADVAIEQGRIARIGRIPSTDARTVLDASGLVVAPGFVDLHTHYDAQLFWDPYLSLSGWHGVTSVVIGNCGFGFAPVRPDARERAMLTMTRVEAIPYASMAAGMPWDWVTFPEFLDSATGPRRRSTSARSSLSPRCSSGSWARAAKAGELPTDAEHEEMRRLLHEAMDAGAGGWSAQRLEPASGASRATGLRRHPDDDRRHARRDVLRACRSARRTQRGLYTDDLCQGRRAQPFVLRAAGRPSAAAPSSTTW